MGDVEHAHDELWRLIDGAQADEDHQSANRKFAAAEQLALQIVESNPNDAEACYGIALSWYHRWARQSERRNCVHWLRKAAKLDPDHPWVPLFLGHQFFDDQQYEDAFAEFSRVDMAYFASIQQHWRNLKTQELMLCCRIRGDFATVDIASLKKLVSGYVAAELVDRPIPSELIKTMIGNESLHRFDAEPHAVAKEMCRLIEGIGNQDVFAEELAEFEAGLQNGV